MIYAVLMLLGDGIFWANEVNNPSATRLVGALVCAVIALLMLFNTYVVRLREKLERERESVAADRAVGE